MATDRNAADMGDTVWYFAYGSNMSRAKFTGGRGIEPLAAARVLVPGWTLTMEIPGMPYSEPGMSSIAPVSSFEPPPSSSSSTCYPPATAIADGATEIPTAAVMGRVLAATSSFDRQESDVADDEKRGLSAAVASSALGSTPSSNGQGGQDRINSTSSNNGRGHDLRTVHGVAYLVTRSQHIAILASEGGGIAYDDVELAALAVGADDEAIIGSKTVSVRTLVNVPAMSRRDPEPLPSARYKGLLTAGADEAGLPREYRDYLQAWPAYVPVSMPRPGRGDGDDDGAGDQDGMRRYIGAMLFLAIWGPLLAGAEKLCYATLRKEDGSCPVWVKVVVRWAVVIIWWSHDVGFAPIFGRGDGGRKPADKTVFFMQDGRDAEGNSMRLRSRSHISVVDEKAPLLDIEAQSPTKYGLTRSIVPASRHKTPFWVGS